MTVMSTIICNQLRGRFIGQDGAVFFEVPNGTGANKTRTADGISVEFWKSRGYAITGYEFKVSRGDWLKELKSPAKAEAFWKHCDYWYLVVTDRSIVKEGELPSGWGLMLSNGNGLTTITASLRNPEPILDRAFFCGLLRAASAGEKRDYQAAVANAERRGRQTAEKNSNRVFEDLKRQILEKQQKIQEFETGFGVNIYSWEYRNATPQRIGELVRRAINGELDPDTEHLLKIRNLAKQIVADTEHIEES